MYCFIVYDNRLKGSCCINLEVKGTKRKDRTGYKVDHRKRMKMKSADEERPEEKEGHHPSFCPLTRDDILFLSDACCSLNFRFPGVLKN